MDLEAVSEWLKFELEEYPSKSSQGDFIDFLLRKANKIHKQSDQLLKNMVIEWISSEQKDLVTWGMTIAIEYNLNEATPYIEKLLSKVKKGELWTPYYIWYVEGFLERLVSQNNTVN